MNDTRHSGVRGDGNAGAGGQGVMALAPAVGNGHVALAARRSCQGQGGTMFRSRRRLSALFPNRVITSVASHDGFCGSSGVTSHKDQPQTLRTKGRPHM